jgi:hypothetical protein
MTEPSLDPYLERPVTQPDPEIVQAIQAGPMPVGAALQLRGLDRLLDPAPLPRENGWCVLDDGTAYVAVRTPMPAVTGKMVDWWFDWHPRDSLRYRIWHPSAHRENSLEPPASARAKRHWGAVHHPVEDVGTGMVHARIEFRSPSEMGMSGDAIDDPRVATIVCGYAGDDRLRVRHTPMFHVFLNEGDGVVLRSRFWLGASLRPYGPLGNLGERFLNTPFVRRRALPKGLPKSLASHCAEEYANLGTLLPELYDTYAG